MNWGLLKALSPYGLGVAIGVIIADVTVDKFPEHAGKVKAAAWVIGGTALGTAIAPGVGTAIGFVVGVGIAWWTSD